MIWSNKEDNLGLELQPLSAKLNNDSCTRRNVLKIADVLFDLGGIIAPFINGVKFLLQHLWVMEVSWDEVFLIH